MKTPSPYPVLDNKPIDQWKVTELKEELRKRKLPIKGLKDDLVRRLDEALRDELEFVKEDDVDNGLHADDEEALADTPQPLAQSEADSVLDGTPEPVVDADGEGERYEEADNTMTHCNNAESKGTSGFDSGINESEVLVTSVETNIVETTATVNKSMTHEVATDVLPAEAKVQDEEGFGCANLAIKEDALVHVTSVDTSVTVNETVTHEAAMDGKNSPKDDFQSVGYDSNTQLKGQESGPPQDAELNSSAPGNQISEVSTDVAFQVAHPEAEEAKPPQDAVKLNSSVPSNQVSEVSTVLGFQVKSDSISSDCVSINEKNELKDNIIDDNVKLELDVKPEMVHPSSSNVISDGSEPHPMDVEEPRDKKEPVDEGDEKNANLEINKKNDSIDVGSSEKLNLDRSSGDDSMDDDTIENKPIDSKYNPEGVVNDGEKTEESVMEEVPVVMSDSIPADKKHLVDEKKNVTAAPIMKRKQNDQVVGNNEISKRQRRWNTGTVKVPEPQSNTASSVTPMDTFSPTTLKRNFSRSDSTASEETPKERVVPPSPKSPTTSLKIDRFLRPFTLKAVHELLGKTGSVTSFWMDHIKTHCYVTYSSVEEAIETRNAVYNLQWPPNGGRFLLAEFVDPQEVKTRTEAPPPSPATPVGTKLPPPPPTGQPPRQQVQRQQPLPPPPSLPLPPPPPLSNPPQARERLPPPPPVEKIDTPIVTLDDLFRKTKATPRIYYLPLTDEQIAAKQRNTKQ